MSKHVRTLTHEGRRKRRKSILAVVKNGMPKAQAAVEFGVSLSTIIQACRGHKYPNPAVDYADPTPSGYRVIALLQNTNLGVQEIAKKTKRSRQRVYQIWDKCKKAGIKFPKR